MKQFYKEENYSMFKYNVIENLINKLVEYKKYKIFLKLNNHFF